MFVYIFPLVLLILTNVGTCNIILFNEKQTIKYIWRTNNAVFRICILKKPDWDLYHGTRPVTTKLLKPTSHGDKNFFLQRKFIF